MFKNKIISIIVVSVFLTVVFNPSIGNGYKNIDERNEDNRIQEIDILTKQPKNADLKPIVAHGGRSYTLMENDNHGGSWVDSFEDEMGVDWGLSDHTRLEQGDANINCYYGLNPNAIALWHFDEGSGTTANDSSGNGNDGTLGGDGVGTDIPTWTTGKFGNALNFDGSNDHINITKNKISNIWNKFSISVWIKLNSHKYYNRIINDYGFVFATDNDGRIWARIWDDTYWSDNYYSNQQISIGNWTHVAITHDSALVSNNLKAYINGILDPITLNCQHPANNSGGTLVIGSGSDLIANSFNGIIDEIAVYNQTLTAQEIKDIYENSTYRNFCYGNLTSNPITLPPDMHWDTLLINKNQPLNTEINIKVLNAVNNQPIPGSPTYTNSGEFDISYIDPNQYPTIKFNASFKGDGSTTPVLHYWAVSWNRSNTWQDTLFGGEKVESTNNVEAVDGNAQLARGIDPSTVAIWHFDEGSGTIAYDATPNDNDGTLGGDGLGSDLPTWTSSKFMTALDFDGSDDFISVPSGEFGPFNFRSAVFSIELWFKTTASGNMIVAGTYHTQSVNHDFWEIGLSNGKAIFKFRTYSDSNNEVYIESSLTYNDGNWNHIAAVKNEGKKGRLYINGNFVGDDTTSGTYSSVDTNTALYFGSNYLGTKFFNGIIDEVAIYNRTLSAQEIKDHFENYSYIYVSKGNLISKPIQLPINMCWDNLIINKTEPQDTSLDVTILDATSNQPIYSFINLTGTEIDISSINPIIHDSIKLQALFETNGLDTSILHDWSVNWTENTAPRIIDIESISIVNRTKSAPLAINILDREENEKNLTLKVEYKSPSDVKWQSEYTHYLCYSCDQWNCTFLPPKDAKLGWYSFKVTVNDSFQYLDSVEYPDLIKVINNKPTPPEVIISPIEPKTVDILFVMAKNSTDIETSVNYLKYWYRWYKNGSLIPEFDNTTMIPSTATQKYDTWRCVVYTFDGDDIGAPGEAEVVIQNSPPEIAEAFTYYQMYEDNVEVLENKLVSIFSDPDNDNLISSASGQDHIEVKIIQENGTVKFTPAPNWFGTEYITFYANDSSPIEAEQTVEVTINPTNDLPRIVQIGNQIVSEDSSGLGFVVEQDNELHLRIVVEDIDGDVERGMIQYIFNKTESNTFYFQNSDSKLIFQPNNADVGRHFINISITDNNDTPPVFISQDIWIDVLNVNDPPSVTILTPLPGKEFMETDDIIFYCSIKDLDLLIPASGERLTYYWYSNKTSPEVLGTSQQINVSNHTLKPGHYNISVMVEDAAGEKAYDSVEIVIKGVPKTPEKPTTTKTKDTAWYYSFWFWVLILIIIIVIIIISIGIIIASKKKKRKLDAMGIPDEQVLTPDGAYKVEVSLATLAQASQPTPQTALGQPAQPQVMGGMTTAPGLSTQVLPSEATTTIASTTPTIPSVTQVPQLPPAPESAITEPKPALELLTDAYMQPQMQPQSQQPMQQVQQQPQPQTLQTPAQQQHTPQTTPQPPLQEPTQPQEQQTTQQITKKDEEQNQ